MPDLPPDPSPAPTLLVLAGPPGAGKSTVGAVIAARHQRSVLVEGDQFFLFARNGNGYIPPWLPESDEQNDAVTRAAAAAAGTFARHGYATVYDGVVGPWYLPAFFEAAGLPALDYAVLLPSADECVRRVATRTNHGFTDEPATRQVHESFAAAAADIAAVEPRHVIAVDPADTPDGLADRILAARAAGALRYPQPTTTTTRTEP